MQPVRVLLALAISFGTVGFAHAGAQKQSSVSVRFYPEAGAEGGSFSQKVQLLNNPSRSTYMGEIPLLSEREIKAYYPFEARDGSHGTYFKLDDHGTKLLEQHTMSRRGSYLLVFFNGRHVVDLAVDRPVSDGIAVIPSGLTSHDLELLEMKFPVIGKENVKPPKKKKPEAEAKKSKAKSSPTPEPKPRMSQAMVRQPDGSIAPATSRPGGAVSPDAPAPLNAVGQRQ